MRKLKVHTSYMPDDRALNGDHDRRYMPRTELDIKSYIQDRDKDTGITCELNADEDIIRMRTVGVERVHVAAGGNVQVGTIDNDPDATLHIRDDKPRLLHLERYDTNGAARIVFSNPIQEWWTGMDGSEDFIIQDQTGGQVVVEILNGTYETRIGNPDAGNYNEIEADGTLHFVGNATVWEDLWLGFESSKIPGANFPTWAAFMGNTNAYRFAVNDYLEPDATEIQHGYLEGSNIEIHVHWVTNGLELVDKYVRWEVEYTLANTNPATGIGDAFPATTVVSAETTIPANTPDRTNMYTSVVTVVAAALNIGAIVKMRVRRIAATGGAAPAVDPFGLMAGVHIECDTVGSRTITTK